MKKYYKAVRIKDGKFYSYMMDEGNWGLCTEYKENEFVVPADFAMNKGYGLTCFSNKRKALYWAKSEGVTYECEIGNEMTLPDIWGREVGFSGRGIWNWPEYTVMTDKIKLVRRIK
jgi:hypothetical protein